MSPYNGVSSIQAELPKLTLRDAPEDNSFSSVSSPVPGPLSPPLGPMSSDIGDLHDVPINDNAADLLPANIMQTQSADVVYFRLLNAVNKKSRNIVIMRIYRWLPIRPMSF